MPHKRSLKQFWKVYDNKNYIAWRPLRKPLRIHIIRDGLKIQINSKNNELKNHQNRREHHQ